MGEKGWGAKGVCADVSSFGEESISMDEALRKFVCS